MPSVSGAPDFRMAWRPLRHLVSVAMALFMLGDFRFSRNLALAMESPDILLYRVTEEADPGVKVGNIIRDAGLNDTYPDTAFRDMTFVVLDHDHPAGLHRYLDITANGDVATTQSLDREVFCAALDQCILTLDVEVRPFEYFRIIKIHLDIADINDHVPEFEDAVLWRTIPESIPVGSTLPLPLATDPDSPAFGIQNYTLEQDSGTFGLLLDRDADRSVQGVYLEILAPLDREMRGEYLVTLVALDGGPDVDSASAVRINITVSDANDNRPEFAEAAYRVSVAESLAPGSFLLAVSAADPDHGPNAQVRYALSARSLERHGDVFAIDGTSGEIWLAGNLDYESTSQYALVVQAVDGGAGSDVMTSEVSVIVTVEDVNDNAPSVMVTAMVQSSGSDVTVSEADPAGTTVAHLAVSDVDSGDAGRVTCSVQDAMFSLQQLYATDFILQTAGELDREQTSIHDVTILCFDQGYPQKVTETVVRVRVEDANDNAPEFEHGAYHVSLEGQTPSGTLLLTVQANDLDHGANGQVMYSIDDPFLANIFVVDRLSGDIRTNSQIHVSLRDNEYFNMVVIATDGASPEQRLSGSTTIAFNASGATHLQIQTGLNLTLPESSPPGTTLEVWNPDNQSAPPAVEDCGNAGAFVLQPAERHLFNLVSLPGGYWPQVLSNVTPDRETQEAYGWSLVSMWACGNATGAGGSLIRIDPVTVNVLDFNDNAPVIHFPQVGNDTIVLNASRIQDFAGSRLAKVEATDLDIGSNSLLVYRIDSDYALGFINIREDTGEIFLNDDLTGIPKDSLLVVPITVQDQGSPPLWSDTRLRIEFMVDLAPAVVVAPAIERHLTVVLAVSLPGAFLLVVTAVLLALVLRRLAGKKQKAREKENKSQNSADPETPGSRDSPDAGHQLWTSCHMIFDSVKLAEAQEEFIATEEGHLDGPGDTKRKSPSGATTAEIVTSSRDSDSGCSTDMSHGTGDSWTNTQNPLRECYRLPLDIVPIDIQRDGLQPSRSPERISSHERSPPSVIQRCGSYHCGSSRLQPLEGAARWVASDRMLSSDCDFRRQPRTLSFDHTHTYGLSEAHRLPPGRSTGGITRHASIEPDYRREVLPVYSPSRDASLNDTGVFGRSSSKRVVREVQV